MQGRFGFRHLQLGSRKSLLASMVLEPPCKEGLASTVFAPHRLKDAPSSSDPTKFLVDRPAKSVQPDREGIEAVLWDGPATQGIEDLMATLGADVHATP